jgi:dynein heavy chain
MQAMRHEEFRAHQESYRLQHTDVKLDTIESSIRDVLVENCKKSLIAFKEENRIPMKDERGDDIVEEQAPLLVGDETGKEMPFTQEATIRTHYKRLHKFVRLVDYLVLDSKIDMMNNSTE